MQIKKHIPNAITCCNLLSGVAAVLLTLRYEQPELAAWCIVLAAVFDFFDGLLARALGVSSPIGKDLDSLADVVSFGLAPSVLVWAQLEQLQPSVYNYGVFVLVAFAALRLAKFNNDSRQTTSFRGLPVPSNALFWLGASAAVQPCAALLSPLGVQLLVLVLALVLSALMVGELPMFSFKLKPAPLASLWPQLTLIILSILSVLLLGWIGCSLIILSYIILSLLAPSEEAH